MKEEIKVGQVWIVHDNPSLEIRIVFAGKDIVVFEHIGSESEGSSTLKSFPHYYTLKKPEKVLKKLVAWVNKDNRFMGLDFEESRPYGLSQKELIVKEGSLYVDMSEVEK